MQDSQAPEFWAAYRAATGVLDQPCEVVCERFEIVWPPEMADR